MILYNPYKNVGFLSFRVYDKTFKRNYQLNIITFKQSHSGMQSDGRWMDMFDNIYFIEVRYDYNNRNRGCSYEIEIQIV